MGAEHLLWEEEEAGGLGLYLFIGDKFPLSSIRQKTLTERNSPRCVRFWLLMTEVRTFQDGVYRKGGSSTEMEH